jgi:predicted Rossmann fold flavoprotein
LSVAIIGAGASGLAASILLAQKGHKVTLFEAQAKVGKKLLATGNGRCNISNQEINSSFFHSSTCFELDQLIDSNTKEVHDFFDSLALPLTSGKEGQLFPMSLQASSVVELLEQRALELGVTILLESAIEAVTFNNNQFQLTSQQGSKYLASKVIVATGSKAMPKLGGSSSGYTIAKYFGHTITPLYPSLTAMRSSEPFLKSLDGLRLFTKSHLLIDNQPTKPVEGDILFRKYGISGLAALDHSPQIAQNPGATIYLVIDLLPQLNKQELLHLLTQHKKRVNNRTAQHILDAIIPKQLAPLILKRASIEPHQLIGEFNTKRFNQLIYQIKNFNVTIDGLKGFDFCEVCSGGISLQEIDNKSFESKNQNNLYFIGEVLDIDGDRGGYNLHFAWQSALQLAKNI